MIGPMNWVRGSVRRQITLAPAILANLLAVNVAYVLNFLSSSGGDNDVVNLAGRQRMLSQKMSKEAAPPGKRRRATRTRRFALGRVRGRGP